MKVECPVQLFRLVTQFHCKKSCANANYRFPSIFNSSGIAGCPARYYLNICQRHPETQPAFFSSQMDPLLDGVCARLVIA